MHKLPVVLFLPLFAACVADEPEPEPETAEIDSAVLLGPTTLTFYQNAGLTGATLAVTLSSPDDNERIRLVSKPDIEAAGLLGQISAVRLRCGARDGRVVLFESWNQSNTDFTNWDRYADANRGGTINCVAGQTVIVNLHEQFPLIADDVGSAFVTTHARDVSRFRFTDNFEQAWGGVLDNLQDGASAERTHIWLTTTRTFRIRQYLTLDHAACSERGAVFEYLVRLTSSNTFTVLVTDSYVDYGFGDLWGCHDMMKADLDASISDGTDDLEVGLAALVDAFAPDHERYYWIPDRSLRHFDMFFGADPRENAPL